MVGKLSDSEKLVLKLQGDLEFILKEKASPLQSPGWGKSESVTECGISLLKSLAWRESHCGSLAPIL